MPLPASPGPDPTADPAADLLAAAEAAALAERVRSIPLPSAVLPGWSSLCAHEYTGSALLLHLRVQEAADALADAGRL